MYFIETHPGRSACYVPGKRLCKMLSPSTPLGYPKMKSLKRCLCILFYSMLGPQKVRASHQFHLMLKGDFVFTNFFRGKAPHPILREATGGWVTTFYFVRGLVIF